MAASSSRRPSADPLGDDQPGEGSRQVHDVVVERGTPSFGRPACGGTFTWSFYRHATETAHPDREPAGARRPIRLALLSIFFSTARAPVPPFGSAARAAGKKDRPASRNCIVSASEQPRPGGEQRRMRALLCHGGGRARR